MTLLLTLAALWLVTAVAVLGLLRRAWQLQQRDQEHALRLRCCTRGLHRDTLDTEVDNLPQLAWRCVDCGARTVLGVAYATGSNRKPRRTKHG